MSPRRLAILATLAACVAVAGCKEATPEKPPPISQKVRVENLQARIDKTYRLSETESVKIVIVPGFPFGERCVIYSNAVSSTMQCREIMPREQ